MIAGNSQSDISKQFNLSLRAVHQQVEAARRKTGCLNTAQLIATFTRIEAANEIKSA
jgi:DNA-binding CsgD family transcriptional regulator